MCESKKKGVWRKDCRLSPREASLNRELSFFVRVVSSDAVKKKREISAGRSAAFSAHLFPGGKDVIPYNTTLARVFQGWKARSANIGWSLDFRHSVPIASHLVLPCQLPLPRSQLYTRDRDACHARRRRNRR